jgi:hypothetical protein
MFSIPVGVRLARTDNKASAKRPPVVRACSRDQLLDTLNTDVQQVVLLVSLHSSLH